MAVFTIQAGNVFVASWRLRNGRVVAALHYDPDLDGYSLKGDGFGGWCPKVTRDQALVWAEYRVLANYSHAKREEQCGLCARIGTNDTGGPKAHSPGCSEEGGPQG